MAAGGDACLPRVTGAGMNTPTAAFQVEAKPVANITTVTIDNPMTNGDPSAILMVTRVAGAADTEYRALKAFYVFYEPSIGKWRIRFEYNYPAYVVYMPSGYAFNVR